MAKIITQAEKEILLATNYWKDGEATKILTNAMKELSRRAGERGTRVVMKLIYDRGSIAQILEPHQIVTEKVYTGTGIGLPARHEIPNIDLDVMNYHRPALGTFHAKFMIVDRKLALLQSNNIQDNDNMEMMIHLEGPVVDSLYDMAVISWHRKLEPPLPCLNSRPGGGVSRKDNGDPIQPQQTHFVGYKANEEATGVSSNENMPIKDEDVPVTQLSVQTPLESHGPLAGCTSDESQPAEVARVQESASPSLDQSRMQGVSNRLNHTTNVGFQGDAPECTPGSEMAPYVIHAAQEPYPMALVNRPPYAPPTQKSLSVPQNEAWLSALRNATRSVFIQSPTLNAEPLRPAIVEACERGIDVSCYICLGYNDLVSAF